MADAVPQSLSGLASILSSEPMPQVPMFRTNDPVRIAAEMELYVRNLHQFLRRLFGRFTATNLITTINQGTGIGFRRVIEKRIRYIASSNEHVYVTVDDQFDWRTTTIIYCVRTDSDLYASDLINVPNPDGQTNATLYAGDLQINYPKDLQVGPNQTFLRVTASGALQVGYDNLTGVLDVEFYIFVAALGSVTNQMSTIRFGNAS